MTARYLNNPRRTSICLFWPLADLAHSEAPMVLARLTVMMKTGVAVFQIRLLLLLPFAPAKQPGCHCSISDSLSRKTGCERVSLAYLSQKSTKPTSATSTLRGCLVREAGKVCPDGKLKSEQSYYLHRWREYLTAKASAKVKHGPEAVGRVAVKFNSIRIPPAMTAHLFILARF